MTNAKFTPGPWRIGFADGVTADIAVRNLGYTPIMASTPPFAFGAAVALVDGAENANLIAAAPDLYAAVKAAMAAEIRKKVGPTAAYEWLETGTIPPAMQSLQDYWPSWFEDAASAFAKARGEPAK